MSAEQVTRVALYTRVSTKEQTEGTSLGTQLERLQAHAEAQGWEVVGHFADEGVSGDLPLADREQAGRLVRLCQRGAVDVVAVNHLDRFGRDLVETLVAERDLEQAGVGLVSVSEGIDTRRDSDRMNLHYRAVGAEHEKRRMLERMALGLRARAQAGDWAGGPPPFGFRLEPGESGRNRLAVHDDEAELLRRATALIVDEGCSTWETARTLNALGLTPRVAPRWEHNRLRKVLLSPTLGGTWTYGSGDGAITVEIPEILAPDRHAALLDALGATSTGPRRRQEYYLLSHGRLISVCGATYHGVSRKDHRTRHYRCRNSRPEAEPRCGCHRAHADQVETQVWGEVTALLAEPDRLFEMAGEFLDLRGEEAQSEQERLDEVDRELAALEQARTERVAAALRAGLDPAILKAAVAELEADERKLLTRRARLEALREKSEAESDRWQRLQELAESAHERLGAMGPRQRRAVLDLLDVRVSVTGWKCCEACGGRGKVRGGKGGLKCRACHGMRRVPTLRIEGVVLDALDVGALTGGVSRRWTCSRR